MAADTQQAREFERMLTDIIAEKGALAAKLAQARDALASLLDAHARNVLFGGGGHWDKARAALAQEPCAYPACQCEVIDWRGCQREAAHPASAPAEPEEDADILASYSRTDGRREWVNVGVWLRPGEVIAHMDAGAIAAARREERERCAERLEAMKDPWITTVAASAAIRRRPDQGRVQPARCREARALPDAPAPLPRAAHGGLLRRGG